MSDNELISLVVAYDDVNTAMTDYEDLARVHHSGDVGSYDAAVVERSGDSGHDIAATTIRPREKATLRGAGLGLIVGAIFNPAVGALLAGAGLGAVIGNVADRVNAFRHADLAEVGRVVDGGDAHLIVIAAPDVIDAVNAAAQRRTRRVVLRLDDTDIDLLKAELQRVEQYPSPPHR